jgi:hypothetical protein
MTVQELYDWAKANNCLDVPIAKNANGNLYDVEDVFRLRDELPVFDIVDDRVVIH